MAFITIPVISVGIGGFIVGFSVGPFLTYVAKRCYYMICAKYYIMKLKKAIIILNFKEFRKYIFLLKLIDEELRGSTYYTDILDIYHIEDRHCENESYFMERFNIKNQIIEELGSEERRKIADKYLMDKYEISVDKLDDDYLNRL